MRFDEIGYWSEVKLDIIREYATAYSAIVSKQRDPSFHHVYIDGFSGAGEHLAKSTGEFVPGSPLNALSVEPPFKEYFLVDLDGGKIEHLQGLVGDREDVHLEEGDCNTVLMETVFPKVRYEDYRRGLCVLDPYGLHLDWEVIEAAGKCGTLDIFLNFPIMDMNRNALWRNPEKVPPEGVARMSAFWGDDSWRSIVYRPSKQPGLFDKIFGRQMVKAGNKEVVEAFRNRLQETAGFKHVPNPMPMRNSKGAVVYYLFFASHKPVAARIVKAIFGKHRTRGA